MTADASSLARQCAQELEHVLARGETAAFSNDALQKLFAAIVKAYAQKFEAGERFSPTGEADVSATAILIATTGLLKGANLEIFELGMWQSWSGTR